jgi:deazaflavin-dependent oxidoreductase (nitroreductase family)
MQRRADGHYPDPLVRFVSRLHAAVLRASRGRLGARLANNDMALLVTEGRRSGRHHTVPLLYLRDGAALIVIASFGGRDHHPDWYLNLRATPHAEVRLGSAILEVQARTAEGAERRRLWARAERAYPGYAEYQARTDREIPVVVLEPRDAGVATGSS